MSVTVPILLRDLASFDPASQRWRVAGVPWRVWAGSSSAPADLESVVVTLPERSWSVSDRRAC
jgi:hypothetical protein